MVFDLIDENEDDLLNENEIKTFAANIALDKDDTEALLDIFMYIDIVD